MTILKFIEKDPKQLMMEEMIERLENESARQWAYIKNQNNTRKCSGS